MEGSLELGLWAQKMVKVGSSTCAPFMGCVPSPFGVSTPFAPHSLLSANPLAFHVHGFSFLMTFAHTWLKLAAFPTPHGIVSVYASVLN